MRNNANDILFRCSSLGHIAVEGNKITNIQLKKIDELLAKPKATDLQLAELKNLSEKRDAKPELTIGVITHLIDVYVSNQYNRFTDIKSKFLDKGNEVEEDSITTVSRINKKFYKKNIDFIHNKFIKGTPDLYEGESIYKAKVIRDTKSSWDLYTFTRAKHKECAAMYKWQVTGYMDLTGADTAYVDYCLNNTPYNLINKELYYEGFNHTDSNTPAWIELQLIANHVYDKKTFDDYISIRGININEDGNSKAVYHEFVEVDLKERYFSFEFHRNENDINFIHKKVLECREYMNENFYNK